MSMGRPSLSLLSFIRYKTCMATPMQDKDQPIQLAYWGLLNRVIRRPIVISTLAKPGWFGREATPVQARLYALTNKKEHKAQ
ncbi:hypothetical protein F4802DRAFT_434755 [Xylaria palmicola]|nr:hypothetical protein F4802DRAFT_434755 [Xylaria palmicola]